MLQRITYLILPMLILVGCGGGSGTSGTPTQQPSPAFSTIGSNPTDGKTDVSRSETPKVDFNLAVDPNSITSTSIKLVGPLGNTIPTVVTPNLTSVSLRPTGSNLPGNTKYTIELTSTVADVNGKKLSTPFKSTFTTTAQHWDANATIIGTLPYLTADTYPTIAADSIGNITAVWQTKIVGKSTVFASRLNGKSGVWSAASILYSASASAAFGALKLAVGSNEDTYLVWKEYLTGNNFAVHAMRFNATANSWSQWTEFNISHLVPNGSGLNGTSIFSDKNGYLTIISSTDWGIFASRFDITKATWTVPQRLDDPAGSNYLFGVDAIVDNSGNITAAWVQLQGLQVARYSIATNKWSAPYLLDDSLNTNGPTKYFSMGSDSNGNVSIAWGHNVGLAGAPSIRASRLDVNLGKWSKETQLNDGNSMFGAGDASLVVDPLGNLIVVWYQYDGLFSVKYNSNNSLWSAPEKITLPNTGLDSRVVLSNPDIAGNITLLFRTSQNIMSSQYVTSTGQWQVPVAIDTPSSGFVNFSNLPVIVSDLSGNVAAVWFSWNNVLGNDQYAVNVNRFK